MSTADRLKYFVAQYGIVITAVLALGGVAAFGVAWTAAQPAESSEQIPAYQEEISTSVDTQAVVTGNTTLYNQSEVLRDKPIYLFGATPKLTLVTNTTLEAERLSNITHRIILRYRATQDGEIFWQNTTTYMNETRQTTDGVVSTTETINFSSIQQNIDRFRMETGGVGTVSVQLLLRVNYEVLESPTYEGSMSASAPVVINSNSYRLGSDLSASQSEQDFAVRRTMTAASPIEYIGFGAIGILALAGAGGAAVIRRDLDAEEIRTRISRNRYSEWISRGEIPTGTDKRYVRIDTLTDIVDIGIDSNKRVIWYDEHDIYAVIDGDIVYYYNGGSAEIGDWLNL